MDVTKGGRKMAGKYCVMHQQKFKRQDVKHLQREANREWDDEKRYKNKVDLERTGGNFYFVRSDDWNESINDAIRDAGVKERPDSVVLVGSIYTASSEWMRSASKEQKLDYFRRCYEWESTRTQVINAVVHVDEGGEWHMHTAGVPITDAPDMQVEMIDKVDKKGNVVLNPDGTPKRVEKRTPKLDEHGNVVTHRALSAKAVFGNRAAMSRAQDEFWETCGKPCGLERGECRLDESPGKRRHLSEREYAVAAQEAEIAAKRAETMAQAEKVENAAKSVETARSASSGPDPEEWIETLTMPRPVKRKLAESWRDYKHEWGSQRNHEINEAAKAQREMERLREQAEAEAAARRAEAERRKREAEEAERQELNRWMDAYDAEMERQKRKAEAHNAAVDARRSAPPRPKYTHNTSVDYDTPSNDGPELG